MLSGGGALRVAQLLVRLQGTFANPERVTHIGNDPEGAKTATCDDGQIPESDPRISHEVHAILTLRKDDVRHILRVHGFPAWLERRLGLSGQCAALDTGDPSASTSSFALKAIVPSTRRRMYRALFPHFSCC